MGDMEEAAKQLLDHYGNREILYVFTTPDGDAVVYIFK